MTFIVVDGISRWDTRGVPTRAGLVSEAFRGM
jgi:hypothetical protein